MINNCVQPVFEQLVLIDTSKIPMAQRRRLRLATNFLCTWTFMVLCVFGTCPVSESASCTPPDGSNRGIVLAGGINGIMVNLTVKCDKDVAHLNWNSGGLHVTSTSVSQECVAQDGHNTSEVTSIFTLDSNKQDGHRSNVAPVPSQQLLETNLECYYFGCFHANPRSYSGHYYLTFTTVTCTFLQAIQASSTSSITFSSTILSGHSSESGASSSSIGFVIQTMTSAPNFGTDSSQMLASSSSSIRPSSAILSGHSSEDRTSSSAIGFSTSFPLMQTSAIVQTTLTSDPSLGIEVLGNTHIQWIISAVTVTAVVMIVLLIITCLIIIQKRLYQGRSKTNKDVWSINQNEPLDKEFIPVDFSKPFLSHAPSDFSITTKLDQLYQSNVSLASNSNVSSKTEKMDLDFPDRDHTNHPVPSLDTPNDAELNLAALLDSLTNEFDLETQFHGESTTFHDFTTLHEGDTMPNYHIPKRADGYVVHDTYQFHREMAHLLNCGSENNYCGLTAQLDSDLEQLNEISDVAHSYVTADGDQQHTSGSMEQLDCDLGQPNSEASDVAHAYSVLASGNQQHDTNGLTAQLFNGLGQLNEASAAVHNVVASGNQQCTSGLKVHMESDLGHAGVGCG